MSNTASADETTPDNAGRAHAGDPTAAPGSTCTGDSGCDLIMKFDTLTPATGGHANSDNLVRGIAAGALPWVIKSGSGSLSRYGHLVVRVRGLVLASNPSVPASLRGVNPFPAFRAVVSWLSIGSDGAAAVTNVSTGDFEANSCGNSDIEARVSLPQPCAAPIVLVTGPPGAEFWFAVTGDEAAGSRRGHAPGPAGPNQTKPAR